MLALTLSAGAGSAPAQLGAPLALDPSVARQGTTLLVAADESVLSPDHRPAASITFALARGMRVDTAAREHLCSRGEAARSTCPESSRIGFGRFSLAVRGYVPGGGGETELSWAIDAYLGKPQQRGDAASVVLIGRLLGADSIAALLAPALGTNVPTTVTTVGRLVRTSGPYSIELRFAKLPVELAAAPITATPSRLELALGAVRRTRQDFIRRFTIKTPSGSEVRKIRDHRLVAHYLLRTPRSCNGSWRSEVRVGLPGGDKRTRPGEKAQWLLIKRRDETARPGSDIVAERPESIASGRTLDDLLARGG